MISEFFNKQQIIKTDSTSQNPQCIYKSFNHNINIINLKFMKKLILAAVFFISANHALKAQQKISSIKNNQSSLVINDSVNIEVGSKILINLPAGKDFMFVKVIKTGLSTKLIGSVADIAGNSAAAIGLGSSNLKILQHTSKVMNTANKVRYSANALEKLKDLPISSEAKKIAGKELEIISWEFREEGYFLLAKLDKKKYEIYLQEALYSGEIIL